MPEPSPSSLQITPYRFPYGLPAFEHLQSFRLIENPAWAPLVLLESGSEPPVRFACAPVALLMPDYSLELSEEEAAALGSGAGPGELRLLAILTFPDSGPPTANLLAPVVLNPTAGVGLQSIQTHRHYSHLHPLHQEPPCS